jgi:flagellar biogenesis protein FliO
MGRTVRPGSAIESGLTFGPALSPVSDLACDESSLASDAAALPAARLWRALSAAFSRIWASFELRRATQRRRSLRVVETVTMGEKRFVAIVQVEGARFLIGGGGVSLLSRLDASEEFASVLSQQSGCQAAESQACSFKVAR